MSKGSSPSVFNEEDYYEQWKKHVKRWQLISDVTKDLHAVSVHMSLTGRAENATSDVPYEEISSDEGMEKIFEKLDNVCLQGNDWRSFHACLNFERFKITDGCAVDEYLGNLDFCVIKLEEWGIELPAAIPASRLLKVTVYRKFISNWFCLPASTNV